MSESTAVGWDDMSSWRSIVAECWGEGRVGKERERVDVCRGGRWGWEELASIVTFAPMRPCSSSHTPLTAGQVQSHTHRKVRELCCCGREGGGGVSSSQ